MVLSTKKQYSNLKKNEWCDLTENENKRTNNIHFHFNCWKLSLKYEVN